MFNTVWNTFFSRFLVEGTQTILKRDMLTPFCYSIRFFTWFAFLCSSFSNQKLIRDFLPISFATRDRLCFLSNTERCESWFCFSALTLMFYFRYFFPCRLVFLLFQHLLFCLEFQHQNHISKCESGETKKNLDLILNSNLHVIFSHKSSHLHIKYDL